MREQGSALDRQEASPPGPPKGEALWNLSIGAMGEGSGAQPPEAPVPNPPN